MSLKETCKHLRTKKNGFRYTLKGPIQRYSCRDCGYKFVLIKQRQKMTKLKELVDGVSAGDISKTRVFLEFITKEYPGSIRNPIYRMTIFRNILRIGFEKNYSEQDQYVRLCKAILQNKAIMSNSDKRHREQAYAVYDIIQKQILPRL